MQWVSGAFFQWIKRLGREADHFPSNSEVKSKWSYTPAPQYVFIMFYLIKPRVVIFFFFFFFFFFYFLSLLDIMVE
jgi:hypothetical protein